MIVLYPCLTMGLLQAEAPCDSVLYPCLTMRLLQAEAPCDSVVPMPYYGAIAGRGSV